MQGAEDAGKLLAEVGRGKEARRKLRFGHHKYITREDWIIRTK